MTNDLGGPRAGNCHARSFIVVHNDAVGFEMRDEVDLGVMAWADLIDLVRSQDGIRLTYDLFDVPQADGTVLRYRAVNEGFIP